MPSLFAWQVFLASVSAGVTAICAMIAMRVLANNLEPEWFGIYSITRQLFIALSPISTFAMGTALTRYIAMSADMRTQAEYSAASALISIGSAGLIMAAGLAAERVMSESLYGVSNAGGVLAGALGMTVGYSCYVVSYAYYRGARAIGRASLVQVLTYGAAPIALALLFGSRDMLGTMFWALAAVFIAPMIPAGITIRQNLVTGAVPRILEKAKELARYALPRLPAGLFLSAVPSFGIFLAPHYGALSEAGYMAVSVAIIALAEVAVAGFTVVVLPAVANRLATGDVAFVRQRTADLLRIAMHLGLFISLQGALWADELIWLWLGDAYKPAVGLLQLYLLAVIPYLGYVLVRNVLDAASDAPFNTVAGLLAAAATILVALTLGPTLGSVGLTLSAVVGWWVLGGSTLFFLRRSRLVGTTKGWSTHAIFVNVLLVGFSWAAKELLPQASWIAILTKLIVIEALCLTAYLYLLRRHGEEWILEIEKRLRPRL